MSIHIYIQILSLNEVLTDIIKLFNLSFLLMENWDDCQQKRFSENMNIFLQHINVYCM